MLQNIKPIYLKIGAVLIIIFIIVSVVMGRQFQPVNPSKDKLNEDKEAGYTYCLVYGGGSFYELTKNEAIFSDLKYDLRTYANSFYVENIGANKLCGFTFRAGYKKVSDNIYEFSGKYYGVGDEIKVTANKIKNNSLRVSIANKNDQKIDDKLKLNGPVTNLINALPIDESLYSIRYLQEDTTIIVTFYRGFSNDTIGTVDSKLKEVLGGDPAKYSGKIRYFVNAVGEFSLEDIKKNIASLNNQ